MKITNNKSIAFKGFDQFLRETYPTKEQRKKADERYHRLSLGYQIYQARIEKKLTQRKLAEKLNTTQSVIARIENGEQNLTTDTLSEIANALGRKIEIQLKK